MSKVSKSTLKEFQEINSRIGGNLSKTSEVIEESKLYFSKDFEDSLQEHKDSLQDLKDRNMANMDNILAVIKSERRKDHRLLLGKAIFKTSVIILMLYLIFA